MNGSRSHAAVAAQLLLLLYAAPLAGKSWSEVRPGVETKPLVVTIGHPTAIRWKIAEHPAFVTVVLDRDLHPRVAAAYERFAAILGVAGDPIYVVMTPHLEPIAAGRDPLFLDEVARRDDLLAQAGLAVRRALIEGLPPMRTRTPALQRYDWIGGGVFRREGEFDKALIDQASFVLEGLDSSEARWTLDYVISDLQDPGGAFVAGQRADSLMPRGALPMLIEGAHYQWTRDELHRLLGARTADLVLFHYGMSGEYSVPAPPKDVAETAAKFGLKREEVGRQLAEARRRMLEVRSKRPDPSWHVLFVTEHNGRMISALAEAAVAFEEPRYSDAAVRAARAVLRRNRKGDELMRAAGVPALPEDFSALIAGLLDTYEATFDLSLIESAIELQELADRSRFADVPSPVAHLAPPAGDELAKRNLGRLAAITGRESWASRVGTSGHRQVIVVGAPGRPETQALLRAARGGPEAMVFYASTDRLRNRLATWMPYAKDVVHPEKIPVATVCQDRTCRTPTPDPQQLAAWLD